MARIAESRATLRFFGDDLDPDEVTKVLGCEPTDAQRKGQDVSRPNAVGTRIAKTGMWRLDTETRRPEALEAQVTELLDQLSDDLRAWTDLSCRFDVNLFVGLFMSETNEGCEISPGILRALGDRGIELWLDIYSDDQE